jgi:O-antigen/teichoic acid export membrane protein
MKTLSHSHMKLFEWSKLISITGSAQVFIQGIGFLSGILIIRQLPTEEYALYTLANTMLGTMVVLADGGVSTGVMSQGGKVWQDKEKLGIVLSTGFELRKVFAICCIVIAAPVLLYLLHNHGASWIMAALIVLSLVPAYYTALTGSLLEIAPKLWQNIAPLQKIQVGANIGRVVLLSLFVFVFPWAVVAVLVTGLPQVWANLRLRKLAKGYVDLNQHANPTVRKEVLSLVKRIFPGAVYYCVSGQITIWLLSVFGSTVAVAHIGALGRLAMALSVFSALFSTIVLPRFARMPNQKSLLLQRFGQIIGGLLLLCAGVTSTVWLFPSEVLWVLGRTYSTLTFELSLQIMASCIGLVAGVCFGLFTSRGWVINPWLSIPVSLASIVLGVIMIDVSTLRGVLLLNLFIAAVQLLMNGAYCLKRILNVEQRSLALVN